MKEDRNCSYPIYSGPMMPGPLPINGMQMPIPIGAPSTYTSVNYDNNIELELDLKGNFIMPCSITFEDVIVPFETHISEEILENKSILIILSMCLI